MESSDYDSIPLLALVAAVVVALIAHLACMSRFAMTSAPVTILAALVLRELHRRRDVGTRLVLHSQYHAPDGVNPACGLIGRHPAPEVVRPYQDQ